MVGLPGPASVQSAAISRSEDFRDSGPPWCAARIQSLGLLGRGMLVCHSHLSHASLPAASQDLLCTCVTGGRQIVGHWQVTAVFFTKFFTFLGRAPCHVALEADGHDAGRQGPFRGGGGRYKAAAAVPSWSLAVAGFPGRRRLPCRRWHGPAQK